MMANKGQIIKVLNEPSSVKTKTAAGMETMQIHKKKPYKSENGTKSDI